MAPGFDQIVSGLLGAAFGVRALDSKRALWARVAYGAVGFDMLRAAFSASPQPLLGKFVRGQSIRNAVGEPTVPLKFKEVRVNGINERVARIWQQLQTGPRDPKVYSLARSVLSRKCGGEWCVPERDALGEVKALFHEVRSRVRYTYDPLWYDAFQTPGKTLELRTADCDDSVSLLGAMLNTIGYRTRMRVVHTKGFSTWNHIYLMCQLPKGEWMALDTTVDKPPGWQVPEESMVAPPRDFEVTEKGAAPKVG